MNKKQKMILLAVLAALLISAASVQPQLSYDEQNAIIDAIVQTMNPDIMKATIVAEVEQDLIEKFTDSGYVGLAAALQVGMPEQSEETTAQIIQPTATPVPELIINSNASTTEVQSQPTAEVQTEVTGEVHYDSILDYANGAVQQPDGSYRGLHAKQVNAYAYTIGEDEDGVVKQFHTEYTPNTRFNVDVVFENDGSVVWPAHIEMRHIGNVGEYTGHAESVYIDRTYDPVKPGDRAAFTVSAYGSENLGWTTFYFQLYDADSGSVIEGGQGSFTYHAI